MSRVYLIRHGKPASAWGETVADVDPGLDETGRAQAEAVALSLLTYPKGERPTWVLTSPLRRCRETAEPLARALGCEPVVSAAVAEIPTPLVLSATERGPWLLRAFQGRWDEMVGDFDYLRWRAEVVKAVADAPGAAIFTHFVAINAAVSTVLDDPRMLVFRPDHVSVTVLDLGRERPSLVRLGREATTGVL